MKHTMALNRDLIEAYHGLEYGDYIRSHCEGDRSTDLKEARGQMVEKKLSTQREQGDRPQDKSMLSKLKEKKEDQSD